MAQFVNMFKVELTQGTAPVVPLRQMYYGDVEANRFGAIVLLNGEPAALAGTCSGTAILADGSTVAITGTVDGNEAYVDLPAGCYSVEGQIQLFVKLTVSDVTTTLITGVGTVRLTETDTVIDPGTIIPSVAALIEDIEDAVASIPADYSALLAAIAPAYADLTFPVKKGTFCWYSGTLYTANQDIATSENWTAAHWDSAPLANELAGRVASLKSALNVTNDQFPGITGAIIPPLFVLGTRYVNNGADTYASNNVRLSFKVGTYITLKQGDVVSKKDSYINAFGGGYSTNNGSSFVSIPAQTGEYVAPYDGIYFFWLQKPNDAVFTDADVANGWTLIKFVRSGSMADDISEVHYIPMIKEQFPGINGVIMPPPFSIGTRYVNSGADTWLNNNTRMTFKKGTYLALKQGDIVKKNSAYINAFSGGYSTNNGSSFTSISNRTDPYTIPADGIYFFTLAKQNDATFTDDEAEIGWKYISFIRNGSMKDILDAIVSDDSIQNIKTAIGYEYAPVNPTEYYEMPNPGKGLSEWGVLTNDSGQDASDFISLDGLYDICRIVPNIRDKYGLGSICFYSTNNESGFIAQRVQPGTNYDFTTYNGENVAWYSINSYLAAHPNAKYVRFCGEAGRGFKYWVVQNGPQASVLEEYKKLPLYGEKIVNFGDSIFGITRPPKDISSYLATKTGATVYNCGFGGCEMSAHADSNYDAFSMYRLAYAIANNTWTLQETAAAASGMPAYFAGTVDLLKTIDFSEIDIVTIAYGANDWVNGSPLDNGGKENMAYYADALRYSIETLLTAYPNLRIFVCSQIYKAFLNSSHEFIDDVTTHVNSQGNTAMDFNEKTEEVAKEYMLPYINDFDIGMNKFNRLVYFPSTDGSHPKPEGNMLIADNIAHNLY